MRRCIAGDMASTNGDPEVVRPAHVGVRAVPGRAGARGGSRRGGPGACAGPLVVAACVLGPNRLESLAALDDSKKLNEKERERLFPLIRRYALAFHVVFIPSAEVDRRGVHVANIEGMRRAVAGLPVRPGYVLSDGFRVPGLPAPSLPVIGGDAAAACIAAASVLAKVSRDRLMVEMESEHPGYGFAEHKGYSTPAHSAALADWARAASTGTRSSMCAGWCGDGEVGWYPDVELDIEPEQQSRFGQARIRIAMKWETDMKDS